MQCLVQSAIMNDSSSRLVAMTLENSDHVCFDRFNLFGSCFVCFRHQLRRRRSLKGGGNGFGKKSNKKELTLTWGSE